MEDGLLADEGRRKWERERRDDVSSRLGTRLLNRHGPAAGCVCVCVLASRGEGSAVCLGCAGGRWCGGAQIATCGVAPAVPRQGAGLEEGKGEGDGGGTGGRTGRGCAGCAGGCGTARGGRAAERMDGRWRGESCWCCAAVQRPAGSTTVACMHAPPHRGQESDSNEIGPHSPATGGSHTGPGPRWPGPGGGPAAWQPNHCVVTSSPRAAGRHWTWLASWRPPCMPRSLSVRAFCQLPAASCGPAGGARPRGAMVPP